MPLPVHLDRLFAHLEWADERALAALEAAPGASARALELFAHVLGAEAEWLGRLEQRAAGVAVWPALDLRSCRALAARNREQYAAYLATLTTADLQRTVHYRNSAGAEFDSGVEDILLHVALHGAYHRGQVALLLRDARAVPNGTDYIAFIRGVPAAARSTA
jgi:uncharacterized damage-inducible protein DinB